MGRFLREPWMLAEPALGVWHLASYKKPTAALFDEALPRKLSGNITREQMRSWAAARPGARLNSVGHEAAREEEEKLGRIGERRYR